MEVARCIFRQVDDARRNIRHLPHETERIAQETLIQRRGLLGGERWAEPSFRLAGGRTLGDDEERSVHGAFM